MKLRTTSLFDALARARRPDPFSVLGPHVVDGRLVIRTIQPAAARVSVAGIGGEAREMLRRHDAGIFEATFDVDRIVDYRLHVAYRDGRVEEIDDPYRYGRVLSDYDLYLFGEGNHTRIYERLGAHPMRIGTADGVHFAVWAPNAERVSAVGDFNEWDGRVHPLRSLGASGVWEIFIPQAREGQRYKFEIRSRHGEILLKADPFGFAFEVPPLSASVVCRPVHEWQDGEWMRARAECSSWFERPMAISSGFGFSGSRVSGSRFLRCRDFTFDGPHCGHEPAPASGRVVKDNRGEAAADGIRPRPGVSHERPGQRQPFVCASGPLGRPCQQVVQ